MKRWCALLWIVISGINSYAQERILRDDSLDLRVTDNASFPKFKPLNYYQLEGFQSYRPFGRERLPLARSGNLGLALHSLVLSPQDWNINYLTGGYQPYFITKENIPYYKMSRPFTQLNYANGASSEQFFKVIHSQNLGEGLNIGFEYRRIVSEGVFVRQLTSHTQFGASYNLENRTKSFSSRGYFLINSAEAQENGGITPSDDDENLLLIGLQSAQNRSRTQSLGFINSWELWKDSARTWLAVSHEIEWSKAYRNYKDELTNSPDFYRFSQFDSIFSADSAYAEKLANSIRVHLIDNMLSIGFRVEDYHYFQNHFIDEDLNANYLEARFDKEVGALRVTAAVEKAVLGGYFNDEFDAWAKLSLPMWKGIQNYFTIRQQNKQADYLLSRQRSNHLNYQKSLQTSNASGINWDATIEKFQLKWSLGFFKMDNYIYLDSSRQAAQLTKSVNNLYAELSKQFSILKHLKLLNRIRYQNISEEELIPLPGLLSYHSFYYENSLVNNSLKIQLGTDVYYLGAYKGYAYDPSSAQFYLSNGGEDIGSNFQLDLFLNLSINKSARIFVKMENVLSNSFSEDTYRVRNYPIPGRTLKLGFSWRMLN